MAEGEHDDAKQHHPARDDQIEAQGTHPGLGDQRQTTSQKPRSLTSSFASSERSSLTRAAARITSRPFGGAATPCESQPNKRSQADAAFVIFRRSSSRQARLPTPLRASFDAPRRRRPKTRSALLLAWRPALFGGMPPPHPVVPPNRATGGRRGGPRVLAVLAVGPGARV